MAKPNLSAPLPIDGHLLEILSRLEKAESLVLRADPGTGKTTRVPPAIAKSNWISGKKVWVVEPRRIAARLSAERVAFEQDWRVGEQVGYRFRLDARESSDTRILFLTEGTLTRTLRDLNRLQEVGVVILDEFHERSIDTDLAFAWLQHLRRNGKWSGKILVMSATLDGSKISKALNAEIYEVSAPHHPLEVTYRPDLEIAEVVEEFLRPDAPPKTQKGDILIFLPGAGEIKRAHGALDAVLKKLNLRGNERPLVCELYAGQMNEGEEGKRAQSEALQKSSEGLRKIILSTNVAETSLTIPGVRIVIDTGVAKQASTAWWSGLPQLDLKPVSQSSMTQRAGRAARETAGLAVRLFKSADFLARPKFEVPEILREDLCHLILDLLSAGIVKEPHEVESLPWLDPLKKEQVERSVSVLKALGAFTSRGSELAKIPLHPRLGAVLLRARELGVENEILGWIVCGNREGETEFSPLSSQRLAIELRNPSKRKQYEQLVTRNHRSPEATPRGWQRDGQKKTDQEILRNCGRAFLVGFFDRVARAREVDHQQVELTLASGSIAFFNRSKIVGPLSKYFVVLDCVEGKRLNVRQLIPVLEDDVLELLELDPSPLIERQETFVDPKSGRAKSVSTVSLGSLEIMRSERAMESTGQDRARAMRALLPTQVLEEAQARWEWAYEMDSSLPKWSEAWIADALEMFCMGRGNIAEEDWAEWSPFLWMCLEPEVKARFERAFPDVIELKSGRRVRVKYEKGKSPWIMSRIQDFFGTRNLPTLGNGKVKITAHLLAPNHRPVQITQDLDGFWIREYPKLRIELGRRYPRHKWPENPV